MPKRILQGTVTSDANNQTVTVSVERRFKHPLLQKTVRKSKKYRAHDEANSFKTGESIISEGLLFSGVALAKTARAVLIRSNTYWMATPQLFLYDEL